jgi:hypothetical protein
MLEIFIEFRIYFFIKKNFYNNFRILRKVLVIKVNCNHDSSISFKDASLPIFLIYIDYKCTRSRFVNGENSVSESNKMSLSFFAPNMSLNVEKFLE